MCETKIPSLKWGIDNEETQFLDMWNLKLIKDIKTFEPRNVGCTSKKNSFLGASPDGIVKCSCQEEKRLIEVKYPYSKKDVLSLDDAVTDTSSFLDSDESLKRIINIFTKYNFNYLYVNFKSVTLLFGHVID